MIPDRVERQREAMRLYAGAIAIVDPIRIRMWSEAELTTGQLRLMFLLRDAPGATLSDLASHLSVSAPTASGLVDRLARGGFVRREEADHDRRYTRHFLTERATDVVANLEREGRALLNEIFGQLTDQELTTLIRALGRLVSAAQAATAVRP